MRKNRESRVNKLKLRLPHTLILIYAVLALMVAATWVVPGGEYTRVDKTLQESGKTVPVTEPGSYRRVESRPQGLAGLFVSPVKGFVEGARIIIFVFIVGGAFAVIQKTGAVAAFIHNLALRFGRRRTLRLFFIPVTMLIFSLGGAVFGMCEETMPFILIFVPLALSLGYDTITGAAIPFVGAAAGFAGAFFNPFTVGIAQGIASIPAWASGLSSGLSARPWPSCSLCDTPPASAATPVSARRSPRTKSCGPNSTWTNSAGKKSKSSDVTRSSSSSSSWAWLSLFWAS